MNAIEVNHLIKLYEETTALNDVSFQVKQGEFSGLIGPNGSGKTTTIGILTSLINKTAGSVSIFGHCLEKESQQAKSHIGLMPQEYNFTLLENAYSIVIRQAGYYGVDKKTAGYRAEQYLKKLGLWDKREVQVRHLSGGEKRCVMLVRALMHDPQLLILDEPTANVDLETRNLIWDFLRELNDQNKTILLTTHYLEEAENLCQHIIIIDQGRVVANNSVELLIDTMHEESLVFNLDKPIDAIAGFSCYDYQQIAPLTYEIKLKRHQSLTRLFYDLSQHRINILRIKNKLNRLEQLFMQLTKK